MGKTYFPEGINVEGTDIDPSGGGGFTPARLYQVGTSGEEYTTIQGAVDAINLDTPPSVNDRATILVSNGTHEMTAQVTIPAYTSLIGSGRNVTFLYNGTTGMFLVGTGGHVSFSDFTIQGGAAHNYAIQSGNESYVYIDNISMTKNRQTSYQRFFENSGATWHDIHISNVDAENSITNGFVISMETAATTSYDNNSTITNFTTQVRSLSAAGGCIRLTGVKYVKVQHCNLQGYGSGSTGILVGNGTVLSGQDVEINHTYISRWLGSGKGIGAESLTHVTVVNTDADNSTFSGTSTIRNSFT